MKIDAVQNKILLFWLLDHTDPDQMLIKIGAGKVLPITPQIISMVLGFPIGGENFKQYSWKDGIIFRQQLISDLNQGLTEDCDIHISNLQQEILKGNVNPLMKRCFFMILCNRLLLPSSSNFIGSVDIKRTMDHQLFGVVDWSQAIFNDLQIYSMISRLLFAAGMIGTKNNLLKIYMAVPFSSCNFLFIHHSFYLFFAAFATT
jgi:hypothetical protein